VYKVAVLPWCCVTEMGSTNSLHALAQYKKCKKRLVLLW